MHLLFVNRFYWPETPATGQLLADLAPALAGVGHEVEVITGLDAGGQLPRQETRAGVFVHRVGPARAPESALAGKARAFAGFAAAATAALRRRTRRGSVVICLTDPPLLGLAAAAVCYQRHARLIHWVQDIYPELAERLVPAPALRLLRPLRDAAWRAAEACVTLGEDMAATIADAGVAPGRIHVVPNWAPTGVVPAGPAAMAAQRKKWGITGDLVVAYSGNLGRVHDLETLLGAVRQLQADPGIHFVFIGSGAAAGDLRTAVTAAGLERVHFLPPQPRDELAATLGAADVHLASLRPEAAGLVFPSKVHGVAAAGRPLVLVAPPASDVARMVETAGAGLVVPNGASAQLAAALRMLHQSPELRHRLASGGLDLAARHQPVHAARYWTNLLARLEAC